MQSELKELFGKLNQNCNYLVLRNWDNIFDNNLNIYGNGHEDIDILCSDKESFIKVTDARRVHNNCHIDNYIITCKTIRVRFDIRWVGDNYYPKEWEGIMLRDRVMHKDGFYVMSERDYCYSLAYHALLQKPSISDEYFNKINVAYHEMTGKVKTLDENDILIELNRYLKNNSYKFVLAHDPSVFVNWENVYKIEHDLEFSLHLRKILFDLNKKIKYKLNKFY